MSFEKKLAQVSDVADKEFDFVIIGGGTAGCVVASRLTEDPNVTVAVLEAAPAHVDDPLRADIMGWMKQMDDPEYDYLYEKFDPPQFRDMVKFVWHRGRSLGGTSAINWLIWNMPTREEIDALEIMGNTGWNWKKFHEYAKKSQRFCPTEPVWSPNYQDLYNPESVGHQGPISISFSRTTSGIESAWFKALEANGIATSSDNMGGYITGAWKSFMSMDPKTGRSDSVSAYLAPAIDRPNLKVLTEATVHRIVTSGENEDVVGEAVVFKHGGKTYQVRAKKEIIVSAGTVKSPHILELSGIGDRKILEPLGIPVKVDLPGVGTNVQEHVAIPGSFYRLKEDPVNLIVTTDLLKNPNFAARLNERHPGLDAYKLLVDGLAFVPLQSMSDRAAAIVEEQRAKLAADAAKYPPGVKDQHEVLLNLLGDENIADMEIILFPFGYPVSFPDPSKPHCHMFHVLARPFSRGTIHITSADPEEPPVPNLHYVEEPADMAVLVEAQKFLHKVAYTEPFKSLIEEEIRPGNVIDVESDESITNFIKRNLVSSWHTTSSNTMLPREKNGVVSPQLKVYGTKNIRVIDLSVATLMPSVHPQAVVYTIAEMGADIIKSEYK